jgi:hypothetical protein
VNRIDQETQKEARAHKGCRAIQEEEEEGYIHTLNVSCIMQIYYFVPFIVSNRYILF